MEHRKEVKTFMVHKRCEKCVRIDVGEMLPTGIAKPTYPMEYQHKCNVCGNIEDYIKHYPEIEYEEIGK